MSHQMHEVEKAYDDPFTMVHHRDLEEVIDTCRATTVVVWLTLLKRADISTRRCWPSIQTIAEDASVSRQTAVNAIEELEAVGALSIEKRITDSGDYTSNLYRLHRLSNSSEGSLDSRPPGSLKIRPRVVQNLDTNNTQRELDPLQELDIGDRAKIAHRRDLEREFAALWNVYPKKEAKQDALKAWLALDPSPSLQQDIAIAVLAQAQNNWVGRETRFIPSLGPWLRGRRWEDAIVAPTQTNGTKPRLGKHGQRVYSPDELIERARKEMGG
jgi:hypothetical protein